MFQPCRSYIGSGAEIARPPAAAAHSNLTNNPYNLTFNLVISFYNFLDKIYRALHFASPTSLNLSRTSGSGLAVLLFYLDLSSASLLLGPGQCFSSRAMSAGASSATALDQQSTRDSYIPVFDGTPANYKEWRKRIIIYAKKMELMNRKGECVLNLLGSLQGTAWKLVEDFDLESVSGDTALKDILALLDAAFQYDSKVEMPADFAAYFESQGRRSGQSLLQFITDHDDRLRRVEKHGVKLPAEVQGWHLLAKSNISKEQKQMVMTQANSLERTKIQQALYSILGQDYKHSHVPNSSRWSSSSRPSGKGRGY